VEIILASDTVTPNSIFVDDWIDDLNPTPHDLISATLFIGDIMAFKKIFPVVKGLTEMSPCHRQASDENRFIRLVKIPFLRKV